MIILGIDPGTAITGYGIIEVENSKTKLIQCGVIRTADHELMPQRLYALEKDLIEIIKEFKPGWIAVEQLFFTTNAKTAIAVGQARGVVLLVAAKHHLSFAEYTPLQIKQAVTGYGKATKAQVQQMVKTILKLSAIPKPDDAADGLAVALTHAASQKFNINK